MKLVKKSIDNIEYFLLYRLSKLNANIGGWNVTMTPTIAIDKEGNIAKTMWVEYIDEVVDRPQNELLRFLHCSYPPGWEQKIDESFDNHIKEMMVDDTF